VGFTPVLALERLVDNPVVLLEGPRPVGWLFKEASPMPPCMTGASVGRFVTPRAVQRRDRLHRWVWALFDAAIWFAAIYGATWLRFDFKRTPVFVATTLLFAVAAMAGHFVVGAFIGPYAVGHQRGSFEETTDISRTVAVTTRPVISGAGTHPFLT